MKRESLRDSARLNYVASHVRRATPTQFGVNQPFIFWRYKSPSRKASTLKNLIRISSGVHYHIQWASGSTSIDWKPFDSHVEAFSQARHLVRRHETFSIEKFDDACTVCSKFKLAAVGSKPDY
jgi:hypothetical protein